MNALFFVAASCCLPGDPIGPLQAKNAVVDLGEVKAGLPVAQSFTLFNPGPAAVAISGLSAGCGCMRPRVDRTLLKPGESTELRIEINTLAQNSGPNAWKVTVSYLHGSDAQPRVGELELQVKAKVIREINVEPVSLSLTIDRQATHAISVTDRRAKPLTIIAAQSQSKDVKLQVAPAGVNSLGQRVQQVQVTVLDSCPPGHFAESLILLTDDPEYRELRVPLMVTRRNPGEAIAIPEQVNLQLAKGQKAASQLLQIRTPDDKRVVVDKIEADHPAIRFKWADGPGKMVTVRLGVALEQTPASGLGNVKVYLAGPKPQVLQIPVTWEAP